MSQLSIMITSSDGIELSGYGRLPSRAAADQHLPELLTRAREEARRTGDTVTIEITEHASDCPGCPDDLGLAPGCRSLASHPVSAR